jgi:predicted Ser/Thr protein kinase
MTEITHARTHARTGQGSFGTVYKANYRGQEVAAKVLNSQMDRRQLAEFQKFASLAPFSLSFFLGCHSQWPSTDGGVVVMNV